LFFQTAAKIYFYLKLIQLNKYRNLLLALLGSILLWTSWPPLAFSFLIFVAWVPLLIIENDCSSWKKFAGYSFLSILVWNILTTWWIWNSSEVGAVAAVLFNSFLMSIPFLLMHFTRKKFGRLLGYTSLIIYWMGFEYLHHTWELSWPWLTMGNSFALHPEWIQWYEYTGTSGGSLWILLTNILYFNIRIDFKENGRSAGYFKKLILWFALLIMPIIISKWISTGESKSVDLQKATTTKNIVIVQPNVDPWQEKFEEGTLEEQISKLISLSELQIDENTAMVVWPETAIAAGVWEDQIKIDRSYFPVWSFLKRHPQLSLLSGIDSYRNYGTNPANASATARHNKNYGFYYDAYNTAAMFDVDTSIQIYHKGKLVPGVETLPSFLNWMGPWFENFGGISGTLGRDKERTVFSDKQNHFKAAPIICYESVYGDYVTDYVRKGANVLTIITNDGWWGNTDGYKQHMNYARLRAIETRKWVVRSANTGISCFIDPLGNVIYPQPWDKAASIKMNVPVNDSLTFYVKHGDVLSKTMGLLSLFLLISTMAIFIRKRFI
jgi:apolipoprotein N-acyltransferase